VQNTFGSRSQVRARFARTDERTVAWVAEHGGHLVEGAAEFTVEHPTEIGGLLEASAKAELELIDVSLRRPNLESVFLHLTGRELRD
jgi:ABC-2 type transport system ATP-binding protein